MTIELITRDVYLRHTAGDGSTTVRELLTSLSQPIGRTYPSKKSAKLGRSGNSKVAKARSVRANSPAKFT